MSDGSFKTILPGQHLTSIRSIAQGVSWYERGVEKIPNPRTISKILDWLEKQSMITIERGKGNRQYTLITLLNWDSYQSSDSESNSKETDSTSARQQSVHINKNDKECIKNDKEIDDDDIRTQEIEKSNSKNDAIVFYQDNFGMLSPYMAEELISWTQVFDDDLLIEAMKRAIERGANNWGYAKRILINWRDKGIKTLEQAKAEEVEFQNQQRARYQKQWNHQRSDEVIPEWFEKRDKQQEQQDEDSNIVELEEIINKYRSNGG